MKFGIESSLHKLNSRQEFRKNRLSDGRTIKCVNECLSVPPALIAQFG